MLVHGRRTTASCQTFAPNPKMRSLRNDARAVFAIIFEIRDGRILLQRHHECFFPLFWRRLPAGASVGDTSE
jgi:hypothetical protein